MHKLSADVIFSGDGRSYKDHVLVLDDNGTVLDVSPKKEHDASSIQHFTGMISPGFINAHCHLELSHLAGQIDTGTGLLTFLQQVVQLREFPEREILDALIRFDQKMYQSGIVAVGDISNAVHSLSTKSSSAIRYYTFVELFDLWQVDRTEAFIKPFMETWNNVSKMPDQLASLCPHAPYSVSQKVFETINAVNPKTNATISVHNQETQAELDLFANNAQKFEEFYSAMGLSLDHFDISNHSSLSYVLSQLSPNNRTLLVHNTLSSLDDVEFAQSWSENVYWVSCPNANLYIESRLPDYQIFRENKSKMCLGTDSLSSNWQLSIWSEIQTVKKYNSAISYEELFKWACLNGAEALGFDHDLGSFEKGKKPGVVHINNDEARLIVASV